MGRGGRGGGTLGWDGEINTGLGRGEGDLIHTTSPSSHVEKSIY